MKAARAAVRQAKALEGTTNELQAIQDRLDRLEAKVDALIASLSGGNGKAAPKRAQKVEASDGDD